MHVVADPAAGLRADTQRNRALLVSAAGRLFGAGGTATMAELASVAGISTATAYRHFASVEDVLAAHRFDVGRQLLAFTSAQEAHGTDLLQRVCRKWVELVVEHGGSMVHTRSAEGYLARIRGGAYYLTVQAEALRRPIDEASRELGTGPLGDEGLFLWNLFFDPREIFDLINSAGLTPEQVARRLTATFTGALQSWKPDKP